VLIPTAGHAILDLSNGGVICPALSALKADEVQLRNQVLSQVELGKESKKKLVLEPVGINDSLFLRP
jgi:hypothetical protein